MHIEQQLARTGISVKAAAVYRACLQTGLATMTEIAKVAGLKRPSTYLAMDELIIRGFVSVSKKGRRTQYAPEHPRRFLQIIRTREREMERLLPELEALYEGPKDKPRIRVFEGRDAMLQMYDDVFRAMREGGGELLFLTAIGDLEESFPEAIAQFMDMISRGHFFIRELNLGDARGCAYGQRIRRIAGPDHHVRLLDPSRYPFAHTDNLIFKDKLMMFSVKKDIFVVVIEHQNLADTYRALFNAAWETAEEVC